LNNLGRLSRRAATAAGCLVVCMVFFGGAIALSDYSVAQAHGHPGDAAGTAVIGLVMLGAFLAGITLLALIVKWRNAR
jgi:hypothetical protein